MLYYNYRTGFENKNEAYLTHAEALRNKWKCDSKITDWCTNIKLNFVPIRFSV
jgi:hypothetical protein